MSKQNSSNPMNRREFLTRASATGLALPFAGTLLSNAVHAAEPNKGGLLKAGLQGGESTNSLDPATFASQVPFTFGRC